MQIIATAMRCFLCLLICWGCGHVSGVEAAAISTAIAMGVSAVGRHANGDCYTWCASGTRCNPATGFCEKVSCAELCKPEETCDDSGAVPKCVPTSELNIRKTDLPSLHPQIPPQYIEEPPRSLEQF